MRNAFRHPLADDRVILVCLMTYIENKTVLQSLHL